MFSSLYALADVQYNEQGLRQYRKHVDGDQNLTALETKWNDKYLSPIIDFMGVGTHQTVIFNGENPHKTLLIEYA